MHLIGTSGEVHNGAERDRRQRQLAMEAKAGDARSLELLLVELTPILVAASHLLFSKQRSSSYGVDDLVQTMIESVIRSLRKATTNPLGYAIGSAKGSARDMMSTNQSVYIKPHDRRQYIKARNELQKSGREPSMQEIAAASKLPLGNVVAVANALSPVAHFDYVDASLNAQLVEETDEQYEALLPRLALLLPVERAYAERCLLSDTPASAFQYEYELTRADIRQVMQATVKILRASFGDTLKDRLTVVEAQVRMGLVNIDERDLTDHQRFVLREVVIKQRSQGDVARELGLHASSVSERKTTGIGKLMRESNGT